MDVPPSKKAHMYVVCEEAANAEIFTKLTNTYAGFMGASQVDVQTDKAGIAEDAVSVVTASAVIYIPLEDLVDYNAEYERLLKEQKKLEGEVKRVEGKLSNQGFVSKAPEKVINEEREKMVKYKEMLEKVTDRLAMIGAKIGK
jgi:valyl-tRNA synthetase